VWLRTLKLTRLVSSKYALVRHTSLMIKMIIKHKKHTVYRVFLRFAGTTYYAITNTPKSPIYNHATHGRASP